VASEVEVSRNLVEIWWKFGEKKKGCLKTSPPVCTQKNLRFFWEPALSPSPFKERGKEYIWGTPPEPRQRGDPSGHPLLKERGKRLKRGAY